MSTSTFASASSRRLRVLSLIAACAVPGVLVGAGALGGLRSDSRGRAVDGDRGLIRLEDWPTTPEIRRGRLVYEANCIGCHGERGEGDGPAAVWLDPTPRNFQKSKFKFRSSASGDLPFEDDLLHTVTCGLPGSSMPGFPLVSEQQRRDVVAYVLDLAIFNRAGILARVLVDGGAAREDVSRDVAGLKRQAVETYLGGRKRIRPPAMPPSTHESVEKGRVYYAKSCASCHGDGGRGDGSSSYSLRDWQDAAIVPRDFTSGVFRGGSTPGDVFLRIRTGLTGTPMPSSSEPDETVWAMVHYIMSLRTPGSIPLTRRMGCDRQD